jgi:hypothetical protein
VSEFLLAEFESKQQAAEAARAAAEAGYAPRDVLSPSPIEDATDYVAPPRSYSPIGWVMFIAGATGAAIGYLMQWYSSVFAYPTDSGGRPLNSWPAFLLVPYELVILSAAVVGILGWMWMCGLPKLHHPLFAADVTERAVQDRVLLVFPQNAAPWVQAHLKPIAWHEINE